MHCTDCTYKQKRAGCVWFLTSTPWRRMNQSEWINTLRLHWLSWICRCAVCLYAFGPFNWPYYVSQVLLTFCYSSGKSTRITKNSLWREMILQEQLMKLYDITNVLLVIIAPMNSRSLHLCSFHKYPNHCRRSPVHQIELTLFEQNYQTVV